MGKPIASQGKFPFGTNGVIVWIAKINGVIIETLRIHKQRSTKIFDLIDENTGVIYKHIKITTDDKDGNSLKPSYSYDDVSNKIKNNSFVCTYVIPGSSERLYITKFQLNKIITPNKDIFIDWKTVH